MIIYTYETEPNLIHQEKLYALFLKCFNSINFHPEFIIKPIHYNFHKQLSLRDGENLCIFVYEFIKEYEDKSYLTVDKIYKVLIACDKSSVFAKYGKERNPKALWGWSNEFIAVDYGPYRLSNQFHECLHLFNVDDCYDKDKCCKPKSLCDNENCIMRYGTSTIEICSNVRSQLSKFALKYNEQLNCGKLK